MNRKQLTVLEQTSIPPPNVVEGAKKKQKTEKTIASIDSKKISGILFLMLPQEVRPEQQSDFIRNRAAGAR